MKVKISTLTGTALNLAVAAVKGIGGNASLQGFTLFVSDPCDVPDIFTPSSDWAQGGPIIEQEEIELHKWATDGWRAQATSYTFLNTPDEKPEFAEQYGPTPLIAAMRCYVASKMGDEIDLPAELLGAQP